MGGNIMTNRARLSRRLFLKGASLTAGLAALGLTHNPGPAKAARQWALSGPEEPCPACDFKAIVRPLPEPETHWATMYAYREDSMPTGYDSRGRALGYKTVSVPVPIRVPVTIRGRAIKPHGTV